MRYELTTFVCPSCVVIMTLHSQCPSIPQSVSKLGQLLLEISCIQYTEYTCKYKILYECVNSNATHKHKKPVVDLREEEGMDHGSLAVKHSCNIKPRKNSLTFKLLYLLYQHYN